MREERGGGREREREGEREREREKGGRHKKGEKKEQQKTQTDREGHGSLKDICKYSRPLPLSSSVVIQTSGTQLHHQNRCL